MRLNRAKNKIRPEEQSLSPHSFVIHRGTVTLQQKHLIMDFRKVMSPYTASSLQVTLELSSRILQSCVLYKYLRFLNCYTLQAFLGEASLFYIRIFEHLQFKNYVDGNRVKLFF